MNLELRPLARQVEFVFRQVRDELFQLTSGIVYMQIRNNVVGKFGVRHDPIQAMDGSITQHHQTGLTERQLLAFRQMAIESLRLKQSWTHGEILFDFAVKQKKLVTSVQFESNYNMASFTMKRRMRKPVLQD